MENVCDGDDGGDDDWAKVLHFVTCDGDERDVL